LIIKIFPFSNIVKGGVIFLVGAYFWQSLISTLTAVFSKYLDMAKATIVYVVAKAIYFICLLYLFFNHGTLNQVLFWNSVSTGFGFLLLYIFLRHYQKLSLAWDFVYWRHIFKIAWPLAIGVVLNLLYFRADTLILSAYHPADKVGLYGAAYKVLEVLTTFPHMFMSLILPLFTVAWIKQDIKKLKQIEQNTYDFFAIINIWVVLVVWLASKPIMILLTGKEFAQAGPIINILILAVAAIFFGTMFTYLVVAMGLQKAMVKYYLLAAILGLSAYFIFIPKYYYWAAAIITVLVEGLIWFCAWRLVNKKIKIKLNNQVLGRSLLAALVVFVIFWWLRSLPVIILVLLVSISYFSLLYLFKAVDKDKLKLILGKDNYA
jgi:O-antigen/teichoic acid export membrane protein